MVTRESYCVLCLINHNNQVQPKKVKKEREGGGQEIFKANDFSLPSVVNVLSNDMHLHACMRHFNQKCCHFGLNCTWQISLNNWKRGVVSEVSPKLGRRIFHPAPLHRAPTITPPDWKEIPLPPLLSAGTHSSLNPALIMRSFHTIISSLFFMLANYNPALAFKRIKTLSFFLFLYDRLFIETYITIHDSVILVYLCVCSYDNRPWLTWDCRDTRW